MRPPSVKAITYYGGTMNQLTRSIQVFDRRAKGYEEYSAWCKDDGLYRLCTEPLEDMIDPIWCLDLACGSGSIGRRNQIETGRKWVFLDLSKEMSKSSSSDDPITFIQGDAAKLPFVSETFGHVVIRSAMQFVNAAAVIREVHRVISPRGHFVVAQKTRRSDPTDSEWYDQLYWLRNVTAQKL